MTTIKQYQTLEELIEGKAQAQHEANLLRGGVFGKDGNRFSDIDIEIERIVAARKGTMYVSVEVAEMTMGIKLSEKV